MISNVDRKLPENLSSLYDALSELLIHYRDCIIRYVWLSTASSYPCVRAQYDYNIQSVNPLKPFGFLTRHLMSKNMIAISNPFYRDQLFNIGNQLIRKQEEFLF